MTFEEVVAQGVAGENRFINPTPLAVAKIVTKRQSKFLFWIATNPQSQQDTHLTKFSRMEQAGDGFSFYDGEDLVLYVAPFKEFADASDLQEEWSAWEATQGKAEWFQRFAKESEEDLLR